MPVLCVIFDPWRDGPGFFSEWKTYAYSEIAIGLVALAYVVGFRRCSPFLCGVLVGTGAFAFFLGMLILPVSVLALALGIGAGAFGFAPFFTSFVLLRNAVRYSLGRPKNPATRIVAFALVVLVLPGLPDIIVHLMAGPTPPGV